MISDNIKEIQKKLNNTKLIAVSKTKSVNEIMEAYNCGIRDFGENKVQELLSKINELPNDIRWHMIGHLQSNKVKDIIGKVYLIHSVDSIKLANIINKESIKHNIITNILLEVNIGNEESKFGFKKEEIKNALKEIKTLTNVNVLGLMCVAPNIEDEKVLEGYFKEMYNLKETNNLEILSMGMSNDYEIAIKFNSTYVRIGTKIFGERSKVS